MTTWNGINIWYATCYFVKLTTFLFSIFRLIYLLTLGIVFFYFKFPQSNLCLILDKVREAFGSIESSDILHLFSENDSCLNGVISADCFRDLLLRLVQCSLNEHEVITVTRAFKIDANEPGPDMQTLQYVLRHVS